MSKLTLELSTKYGKDTTSVDISNCKILASKGKEITFTAMHYDKHVDCRLSCINSSKSGEVSEALLARRNITLTSDEYAFMHITGAT